MPDATRPRLTRDSVLRRALERADTAGLDALTMRSLASELGVVPMALYKHVANKDELVDGMVDLVWAEVEPPTGAGWREAMRARAVSLRAALRRHPWAVGLMESRMRPGLANLAAHDAMMGCLREAGFPLRTTVHVTSVLDAYVYGFALQEKTLPFDSPEESGAVAAEKEQSVPAELAPRFPYLLEVVAQLAEAGYDYDEEFATGLDLILDGVERRWP
ncbi:TetR/AcrR family transcriptional regulator [Leifsonia shinshuensis]|uniref:TetR/AcrR family transcriptional regulator n=1 Tax=Leifsonia shinshuensis TaxID=150026 RepID=UPI001F514D9A|nr:TetR/AcrR family transcriptional regulator [Leifsonia shinshuensis]MCI0157486.1 TetR/AcrR family transcriptional regulator [Leifsonia shinshuensis]